MKKNVPEVFYTTVRKIEPIGGDCVRMYCAVEKNGQWEDKITLLVPIGELLKNAKFVVDTAQGIVNDNLTRQDCVTLQMH